MPLLLCTEPIRERIRTISKLKEEGIETYVLICPVMPYITEVEVLIEEVRPYADTIWIYPLEIKSHEDKNWKKIQPILEHHFPEIIKRFEEIVFSTDHVYWKELCRRLENIKIKDNIRIHKNKNI